MRVCTSSDGSVGYVDVLYDEEVDGPYAPTLPTGQPQLPLAFRFAGAGDYYCPWYIDPNDTLIRVRVYGAAC
jgi:hypothetical protein